MFSLFLLVLIYAYVTATWSVVFMLQVYACAAETHPVKRSGYRARACQ